MADLSTMRVRLQEARNAALGGGVPVRRKDRALYRVLAACKGICEDAIRDNLFDAMRDEITHESGKQHGTGSRRLKPGSDIYNLVSRYVFGDRTDHSSIGKYAQVLREAANRQIGSAQLEDWLAENGGARALYLRIQTPHSTMLKRCLNLNSSISHPRVGEFTLRLAYDGAGFFNVISMEVAE